MGKGIKMMMLEWREDEHEGVMVEMRAEEAASYTPQVFGAMLRASMAEWREQGKRGAWIKLPIQLVNLLQTAVKEGFRYHHAEPDYLMLAHWIPDDCPNTLPANASHRVGIGAFVMNMDNKKVLVVQEKHGILRGSGLWKFPTGVVDHAEDIHAAAVREVKEETGVDTEFLEVLAFRQSHRSFFDKSDLFFLCALRPLSFDIQKQDSEIDAAEWLPWEEYIAQPFVQSSDFLKNIINICEAKLNQSSYSGFRPLPDASDKHSCCLYVNASHLNGH